MILDLLDQRKPFGAVEREIHQNGLGSGAIYGILKVNGKDLKALRFGMAAINDPRDASVITDFFRPRTFAQCARISV